jgi:MYXO-CTERM domain-containing protein
MHFHALRRPRSLRHATLLAVSATLATSAAHASDIVEVLPLTDHILMVHFDDGSVTLAANGQDPHSGDRVMVAPLDTTRASTASSYQLSSTDDPAYSSPHAPTDVGRKSKPTEFANHCDTWSGRCVNTSPDRAFEHWIYLTLPTPLQRGRTYQLDTGTLAGNMQTTSFTYDETRIRSEAVHVNIVAYSSRAPARYGYVYHWMGDRGGLDVHSLVGHTCRIVRTSDHAEMFTVPLTFRSDATRIETGQASDTPNANFEGADVADCDFTAFSTPGEYVLAVDGVGSSFPFRIDDDAFRPAFRAAMRGIFFQRSGIEITDANGEGYSRPAPHHPGVTPGFMGRLQYTTTRYFDVSNSDASMNDLAAWNAGIRGPIDTWGWYQDAGDWDAYFTHTSVPAQLLELYVQNPSHFTDGELNIPESGNGLPDVLDEARWLLLFYHRTRHAIMSAGYGTGGVGGARVMGDLWGSDLPGGTVAGSWQDNQRTWIVSGEDPWMTYRYAGLAAHLAMILRENSLTDPEGIDWAQEAQDAWTWAQANTRPTDGTALGVPLAQTRMHAAIALYRLTGTSMYHDAFRTDFATVGEMYTGESRYWLWIYASLPADRADATIQMRCRASLQNASAEQLADTTHERAVRFGGNFYMPMFLGQGSTPLVNDGALSLAHMPDLAADRRMLMRTRLYTTADYYLGTNPLNMTWISRLGPRYPRGPFNLDSIASPSTYPRAGLIPYGPVAPARDFFPSPPAGPWASNWATTDLYPTIGSWPGHEQWFDQRIGISTCEYTVHQTTVVSAVVYGSLLETPTMTMPMGDGGVPGMDGGIIPRGDGGRAVDGSSSADGSNMPPGTGRGCGCSTPGTTRASWGAGVLLAMLVASRRRRRQ